MNSPMSHGPALNVVGLRKEFRVKRGGRARTLVAVDSFDALLGRIYTQQGVVSAAVPTFFDMNVSTPTSVDNVGTLPLNVEEACQLSWFCYGTPFGPDDHPSNAGYSMIAAAIEAVLPKSW